MKKSNCNFIYNIMIALSCKLILSTVLVICIVSNRICLYHGLGKHCEKGNFYVKRILLILARGQHFPPLQTSLPSETMN